MNFRIAILLFTKHLTHYFFFYCFIIPVFGQNKQYTDSVISTLSNNDNQKLAAELIKLANTHKITQIREALYFANYAENIARKHNLREEEVVAILKKAEAYLVNHYNDSAIFHADRAYQLSLKYDLKQQQSGALVTQSYAYSNLSEYDAAFNSQKQAISILESGNYPRKLTHAYIAYGYLHDEVAQYDSAVVYYLKALDLAIVEKDSMSISSAYSNIAVALNEMKDQKQAIAYYKKAIEIDFLLGDMYYVADSYGNIASCYELMNFKDSALFYAEKSIAIYEELKMETNAFGIYVMAGNMHLKNNNLTTAFSYFQRALNIEHLIEYPRLVANLHLALTNYYVMLKQFPDAGTHLKKAEDYFLNEGKKSKRLNIYYETCVNYYRASGDFRNALEYLTLQKQLEDSLLTESKNEAIVHWETAFNTKQKEYELTLKDLELQDERLALARKNNFIALLIAVFLLLGLLGLILYQYSKSKQKERMQQAIVDEKERGFRSVLMAQEDERRRIASELHDSVGQKMSVLKMSVERFIDENKNSDLEALDRIKNNLISTADDVRTISHQMMPRTLEENGLVGAISDLLDNLSYTTGINYEFDHYDADIRLPNEIEITLFRITQELINNVIKHAEASELTVALHKRKESVQLLIEDNGRGFASAESDGIGLFNIRNRIELLRGVLNIESEHKGGTFINVIIPIVNADA
jgi:signal transduction histidine kinase